MTLNAFRHDFGIPTSNNIEEGRSGQNGTRGKMIQRDFSKDDVIYDVSNSN